MNALTICQPYAELIMRGKKRVENRTWPVGYRGAMLIHAGKFARMAGVGSLRQRRRDEIPLTEMDFGKIVGMVQLRGCLHKNLHSPIRDPVVLEAWPWLATHEHAEGRYCWILEDAFRFSQPVAYRGQQGLFDIPAGIVAAGLSEALEARRLRTLAGPIWATDH
jgi:hypothetical protein